MPRTLRLKIAKQYLEVLSDLGERKKALLIVSEANGGISPRSIERYVAELRGK